MKGTALILVVAVLSLLISLPAGSRPCPSEVETEQETVKATDEAMERLTSGTFSGLALRCIGPAFMSGRVSDIAIDPEHTNTWYVAVASGGVWKTVNAGTTWKSIFDRYGSYSIGCLALDASNPLNLWVGTGENNSQRSVGFGDGVYKSTDGGSSFKKMGLAASEHIGKILVDPRDGNRIFVAAQGPLWAPGGDRGLFRSCDGGASWQLVLEIDENTGVTDLAFDPRDPDTIYAASYQRRRHVWTLIDGGPGSAIHKSSDGGENWRKLGSGLPGGDVGRIGLAVSPQRPDVVYAIIEATGSGSGFYRSSNGGASWRKKSGYVSTSPQYYQEIFACPHVFDRVYSLDTFMKVSDNGGASFRNVGNTHKHVDDHALAFNADDPDYLLAGCDGGLYQSFDRGEHWAFVGNLPVTQFYKLCVDNDYPFYNVYGGTQDNNTEGGPSRTAKNTGICNADWFVTCGGDGFKPQVDPEDPNIVYSQAQHGALVRFDRRTGERIDIQPQPAPGEPPLRWNWDAALMISPHSASRLYFGANRLFCSEDRGSSWRAVSDDLTRQIDRNTLKVMGRVWSIDAVAKNRSTSYYGNIVAVTESPLVEGLIYTGADDGMIQVTDDGGQSWRKIGRIEGLPDYSYVADLEASRHDRDTIFAVLNNFKMGDFKPYVMKSTDRGLSWTSITGTLPERGPAWALAEDHESSDLLFCGTEFGLFFTVDGGTRWVQLKGGVPVIPFRDLEIQRRENDLACATFGRSFYILDDYTPLRLVSEELLQQEAVLFPVADAWMYIPARPLGGEKGSQGSAFFSAPNPPFGAVFTYYLESSLKSLKKERQEKEKKIRDEGGDVAYPTWEELRAEDREDKPRIVLTVRDEDGRMVRRITASASKGIHRVAWDLRYPAPHPVTGTGGRWQRGPLAAPGTYTVEMAKRMRGEETTLAAPRSFRCIPLHNASLSGEALEEAFAFQRTTGELLRAVLGTRSVLSEARKKIDLIEKALDLTPGADLRLFDEVHRIDAELEILHIEMNGDATIRRRSEPTPPSLMSRLQRIVGSHWNTTQAPTATQREGCEMVERAFEVVLARLTSLVEEDLKKLEDALEAAGSPATPGRLPKWKRGR